MDDDEMTPEEFAAAFAEGTPVDLHVDLSKPSMFEVKVYSNTLFACGHRDNFAIWSNADHLATTAQPA